MNKVLTSGKLYKISYEKSWFCGIEDNINKCKLIKIKKNEVIMHVKHIFIGSRVVYVFLYKENFICDGYTSLNSEIILKVLNLKELND